MSKLHHRKFARFFPSYHPRAGEHTYFVEKIWASIGTPSSSFVDQFICPHDWLSQGFEPKHHTIRAGHHVKPGDFIRPSVWSGKPYASKQIIIGPDIEVVKTWDFEIHAKRLLIDDRPVSEWRAMYIPDLAKNDGLSKEDFLAWFQYPKATGPMQIICWNKSIEY